MINIIKGSGLLQMFDLNDNKLNDKLVRCEFKIVDCNMSELSFHGGLGENAFLTYYYNEMNQGNSIVMKVVIYLQCGNLSINTLKIYGFMDEFPEGKIVIEVGS